MTVDELRKKYGTDTISHMIDMLCRGRDLSPHMSQVVAELKADLTALLAIPRVKIEAGQLQPGQRLYGQDGRFYGKVHSAKITESPTGTYLGVVIEDGVHLYLMPHEIVEVEQEEHLPTCASRTLGAPRAPLCKCFTR